MTTQKGERVTDFLTDVYLISASIANRASHASASAFNVIEMVEEKKMKDLLRKSSEVYLAAAALAGKARGGEQIAFEAFFGCQLFKDDILENGAARTAVKIGQLREQMADIKLNLVALHEQLTEFEKLLEGVKSD